MAYISLQGVQRFGLEGSSRTRFFRAVDDVVGRLQCALSIDAPGRTFQLGYAL